MLTSQGVDTPLLVIANKGQEHDIIQAFRLGAADYILWPSRDAEILAAVERVLKGCITFAIISDWICRSAKLIRNYNERFANRTAIINIGKAVISITDQRFLFQKIVDGAAQVTDTKIAWLLVHDQESKSFLLTSHRGLPDVWAKKMNMPLDDGVSSLVALSGETLSISGDPLLKFRVVNLGKSVCVVPIKVQSEVIGMLVVVRKEARPFTKTEETLLEAVSDYASISLVNSRLFPRLAQLGSDGKRCTEKTECRIGEYPWFHL